MKPHALVDEAAEQLETAGFIVQREALLSPTSRGKLGRVRADLLAWAGDGSGGCIPEVLVDVVSSAHAKAGLENRVAQLSTMAVLGDARRAFLYDGSWFEADPSFSEVVASTHPAPSHSLSGAVLPPELIEQLVSGAQWSFYAAGPRRAPSAEQLTKFLALPTMARLAEGGPSQRLCAARAVRPDAAGSQGLHSSFGIDGVVARLLRPEPGWSVLDPWCGTGGRLFAVGEYLAGNVTLEGLGAGAHDASVLRLLAQFARQEVRVVEEPPGTGLPFPLDGLACLPPPGSRRVSGRRVDYVEEAVESALAGFGKGLKRAVFVVPSGFLHDGRYGKLRARVSSEFRLVAVVELPNSVVQGTNLSWAVVVLEPEPTGTETLFARLTNDWEQQCSEGGAFLAAYLEHLERR